MPKAKCNGNKQEENLQLSRRNLFTLAGWAGLLASLTASAGATLRFMFPNIVYEPSPIIKLGNVSDYAEGTITFVESERLFVLRDDKGFRAISAVCQHLACTVYWSETTNTYDCPCHGSVYDTTGAVIAGPAPRALDWLELKKSPDKRLVVNKIKYKSKDDYLIV